MKNKIIIITTLCSIILSACSDKFLDITPESENTAEGFFTTEKSIDQAVIGAYAGLQDVEASTFAQLMNEKRSDNHWSNSVTTSYDDNSVQDFTVSPSAPFLDDAWSTIYNVIERCNTVLSRIGKVEFQDTIKRSQYVGEMKFLRALMYFDLVRYFGGVPIVTKNITPEEALKIGRVTRQEAYDFIISDLRDAINRLPKIYSDEEDVGRATKYAAEGLLGRVFVTMSGYPLKANKWAVAKDLFKDIIASDQYKFLTSYASIFDVANDNGPQCIFYVQFKANVNGEGNPTPTRNADNDISPNYFPFGGNPNNIKVSQDLINSYEPGDKRLTHDIRMKWRDKSGSLITNRPGPQKFVSGKPSQAGDWDINWPVIRYTDVLMMYAECLNELGYEPNGEAMKILNKVRKRAGLPLKTSAEIPDQQAFRLAMAKERRHEFAFEDLRWNDLVRTDRAFDVMRKFLSTHGMENNFKSRDQYIYPIPLRVIQVNPSVKQNPGY